MGCIGAGPSSQDVSYDDLKSGLRIAKVELNKYKSCFCAIMNELERNGTIKEIVRSATENGKCDLSELWNVHKLIDKKRLMQKWNEFSDHEKKVLKEII